MTLKNCLEKLFKFMNNKKIIVISIVFLFLTAFTKSASAEELKPIGTSCTFDGECISGDCETSLKLDQNTKRNLRYCDCNFDSDCEKAYGPASSGDWDCVEGAVSTFDLDYCVNDRDEQTDPTDIKAPLEEFNNPGMMGGLKDLFFDREALQRSVLTNIEDDINGKLAIKIPGLNFSKLSKYADDEGYIYMPWLGEYIRAVYNFAMVAASIIAVLVIILQGIKILTSGGGDEKVESYKKIGHVVIGLAIAWGSYVILFTINPNLVQFKPMKLKYIVPTHIVEEEDEVTSGTVESELILVEGPNIVNNNLSRIGSETLELMKQAADILKNDGIQLLITSGHRKIEKQIQLIRENCQNPPGSDKCKPWANKPQTCILKGMDPANCPHTTGRAVDVWGFKDINGDGTPEQCIKLDACSKDPKFDACRKNECQAKVIEAMKAVGFCSLNIEAWHFETMPPMSKGCK